VKVCRPIVIGELKFAIIDFSSDARFEECIELKVAMTSQTLEDILF